jgi:hypothetical protein
MAFDTHSNYFKVQIVELQFNIFLKKIGVFNL